MGIGLDVAGLNALGVAGGEDSDSGLGNGPDVAGDNTLDAARGDSLDATRDGAAGDDPDSGLGNGPDVAWGSGPGGAGVGNSLGVGVRTVAVVVRIGPVRQCVAELPLPVGPVTLAVGIRATRDPEPGSGPDSIAFSVETSEGNVRPAELDGRYPSTQVATGFTGRVIGMYVTEGRAAFDWFEYAPASSCTTP
ncbi:beta-xylosidase family glycoside hydrolase [Streptomyces sp. NPDC001153]